MKAPAHRKQDQDREGGRSPRPSSLFAAFVSSLAVQAGYNYDGYQNIGMAAMLLPALRDLYPEPEELARALRRHLTYFNAHPYMAGFAAGALIKAEEERANGRPDALGEAAIDRVRHAMGSVLGNIGDRFFWAGLLPLSALLGLIAFLIEPLYGILALLLVYNIPHLLVRAEGIRLGYQRGRGVFQEVSGPIATNAIGWVKRLSAFAAGVLLTLTIAHTLTPGGAAGALLVAAPALLTSWLLARSARRVLALPAVVVVVSLYCLLG